MDLTPILAERVAGRLRRYGFQQCTADAVLAVSRGESLEDTALESAILQELEEYGF